jgi:hypothetical protein
LPILTSRSTHHLLFMFTTPPAHLYSTSLDILHYIVSSSSLLYLLLIFTLSSLHPSFTFCSR